MNFFVMLSLQSTHTKGASTSTFCYKMQPIGRESSTYDLLSIFRIPIQGTVCWQPGKMDVSRGWGNSAWRVSKVELRHHCNKPGPRVPHSRCVWQGLIAPKIRDWQHFVSMHVGHNEVACALAFLLRSAGQQMPGVWGPCTPAPLQNSLNPSFSRLDMMTPVVASMIQAHRVASGGHSGP